MICLLKSYKFSVIPEWAQLKCSVKVKLSYFLFCLGQETDLETKIGTVIPLRARNFLQGAPSYSVDVKNRRFDIHGIIKECLSLFFEIRNMPGRLKLQYLLE